MSKEEWLAIRAQKGIGGSDVSVIFGVNKFKSIFELWEEKIGRKKPEESISEAAHFGTVLEETVKQEFMRRTGLKVRAKNAILQSDKYPWMICNLDGVINENGEKVIFEAKTAIEYKANEFENGIPFEYQLQVQHYFAITGYEKAYVAALVGGNKFYINTVYRDEDLIEQIIEIEKRFWNENVLGMIEPEADGSEATGKFISNKYSKGNGKSIDLPESTIPLIEEYESVSKRIDELTYLRDSIGNKLKMELGDNEVGVINNHKISWKNVTQRRVDTGRLKSEQPEIYSEYRTESHFRRLQVA